MDELDCNFFEQRFMLCIIDVVHQAERLAATPIHIARSHGGYLGPGCLRLQRRTQETRDQSLPKDTQYLHRPPERLRQSNRKVFTLGCYLASGPLALETDEDSAAFSSLRRCAAQPGPKHAEWSVEPP